MKSLLERKGECWNVQLLRDDDGLIARLCMHPGSDGVAYYLDIATIDALATALTAARDEAKRLNEEGGNEK